MIDNGIDLQELLRRSRSHKSLSAKDVVATTDEFDESSSFYQKVFVFTGALERMPGR